MNIIFASNSVITHPIARMIDICISNLNITLKIIVITINIKQKLHVNIAKINDVFACC